MALWLTPFIRDERLQFIKAKYLEKQFVIRDENVTKAAESYLLAEIPDPFDMYSLLAKVIPKSSRIIDLTCFRVCPLIGNPPRGEHYCIIAV